MLISVDIDESKSITPYRKLKTSCRFPDHNAILFTFEVNSQNALGSFKDSRQTVWNFADVSGWDSFRKLTDSDKGYVGIWKNVVDIDENYIRWERKLNSTLHKCFKRKRVRKTSFLHNKSVRSLIKNRKALKREVSICKDKHTSSDFEKKIIYLNKKIDKKIARFNSNIVKAGMNKFSVIDKQSFWKIQQKLAPKSISFPHAVYDKWGTEITDPDEVKQEYKHEFMYRLRKREMSTELKQYEVAQEKVCQARLLKCQSEVTPDFALGEVRRVVNEFKAGKSIDPTGVVREVFMNAGDEFLRGLTRMANVFKKQTKFPHEWEKMWIRTLRKQKGSMKDLNNHRGVFIVNISSLIFEKLLKNRISLILNKNMSQFQTGGVKGKGVTDNLFILRGIVDHSKYLGKELCITFYDIEKCFDSLWLADCLNSLWENGIQNDLLYLIYLLNHRARIQVKSPLGLYN